MTDGRACTAIPSLKLETMLAEVEVMWRHMEAFRMSERGSYKNKLVKLATNELEM